MPRIAALVLCILLSVSALSFAANEEPIGFLFKQKIADGVPVKVYIKGVENKSGQDRIMPDAFKKALVDSLRNRRAIKFEVVDDQSASDVQIAAVIKDYKYMHRGPFKPTISPATVMAEAAATASQNYTEMTADFKVTDRFGNVLWEKTLNEYLKKKMTAEESVPMIYDFITRTFVWKCFGKPTLR
jgi:hypothetical protein